VTLLFAVVIGVIFGGGALLVLERDLVRVTAGTLLMSQSANLLLMASALQHGEAPILPAGSPAAVSDALVQALTLTAVVISFGVTALLLTLVLHVSRTHGRIDVGAAAEVSESEAANEASERPQARIADPHGAAQSE
jgi:multicomponent Na+:H+ antiporter subunit C